MRSTGSAYIIKAYETDAHMVLSNIMHEMLLVGDKRSSPNRKHCRMLHARNIVVGLHEKTLVLLSLESELRLFLSQHVENLVDTLAFAVIGN